ncbi:MAG: 3-phosphoglycerate dehydrogenase [Porticoccaceae bacterium]|nr:3-phosphoglycerate dehydrogenase [Porticoccaceae bacterium]
MFNIQVFNAIAKSGLDNFNNEDFNIGNDIIEPHAYLMRSHKLHGVSIPKSLFAIARAGAGVNNIPVSDYTEKGIVVFNTPGANANAVKELVVASLLIGSRDIIGGIRYTNELINVDDSVEMNKSLEREKKRFAGQEIFGKTLGIVGLGAIGSMVANLGCNLGMRVIGYDPAISVETAWQLSSQVQRMESLDALLSQSDFVTLHVPALDSTKNLLNSDNLKRMKPSSKLLNFARAEIVNTENLIDALKSKTIGGYISDFPLPGLVGLENVLLMPHIGASTQEAEENCAVMASQQLIDFLHNGNIVNSVNFPSTNMARNGGTRITFSNENVPKILGQVLSVFADMNLNIIDMVNKSRGNIAYNIIDVEGEVPSSIKSEISRIQGIINVRKL